MINTNVTYDLALLEGSLAKWRRSPAVRAWYGDLYREMASQAVRGPFLDLGSGIGTIKEILPHVTTSDIVKTPYVERAVSAYDLASSGGPWGCIMAVDVLHHLCRPFDFFASAAGALQPGGRIVLGEPAATPLGRLFYGLFHHEPMRPHLLQPPFTLEPDAPDGEFANMAMAVALFVNHRAWTERRLKSIGLTLKTVWFRDGLAYPMTGGLSRPALLGAGGIRRLRAIERSLPQAFWKIAALRVLVAIEKDQS